MERLPWQCLHLALEWLWQFVCLGLEGLSILRIADDGMADVRHMNSDLMGSSRLQPAFQ